MKANYIVRFHGKQINARIYDRKEVDDMKKYQTDIISKNEMEKYLKKLTKQMKQFAENFQYEKAAQIRDEIQQIKDFWIYS